MKNSTCMDLFTDYEPPIEASPPPTKIARTDSTTDEPVEPPDVSTIV
jgi:hypothetical protein